MKHHLQLVVIIVISFTITNQKEFLKKTEDKEVMVLAEVDLEKIREEFVKVHNMYRKNHQVDDLLRNKDIESLAQKEAESIANTGQFDNSSKEYNGQPLGSNRIMLTNKTPTANSVTRNFYEGIKEYDFENPHLVLGALSFTQLVWKATKYLGCGVASSGNRWGVTCYYYPEGNQYNLFAENVFPPLDYNEADKDKDPLEKIREELLTAHNNYRKKHAVGSLSRNSSIEAIAQEYSEKLASTYTFGHSGNLYNGRPLGENLYSSSVIPDGISVAMDWYEELVDYDFKSDYIPGTGHFTQMVWKESQYLGCGLGSAENYYVVTCNYFPMGNIVGNFSQNVFPSIYPEDEDDNEDNSHRFLDKLNKTSKILIIVSISIVLIIIIFFISFCIYKKRKGKDLKEVESAEPIMEK